MLCAVVHLRQVVDGPGRLRVEERVAPAVVLDGQVALLDVDVRRPVLAHRPELDEVAVRRAVADGEHDVEVADDVVGLGVRGVPDVDHRVGRRGLLAVVDDRVGAEPVDDRFDEGVVGQVADEELDLALGHLAPGADPLVEGRDREERPRRRARAPTGAWRSCRRPRPGGRPARRPSRSASRGSRRRRARGSAGPSSPLPVRDRHPFHLSSGPARARSGRNPPPPATGPPT